MDKDELHESLEIVFDKEKSDIRNQGYSYFYKGTQAENITYPNAEMLLQIYADLKNEVSNIFQLIDFVGTLKGKIAQASEPLVRYSRTEVSYVGVSALCFYTLVQIGYANEAIESLKKRQNDFSGIYRLLYAILGTTYFDSVQLKDLSDILEADRSAKIEEQLRDKERLRSKIIEVRFQQLEKKLKKVNVEINQDKKSLAEKIDVLGLSGNYNELLDCIDNFILTDTSKVVNAGIISTLRTFMADLLKDVAEKIARTEGTKIPHTDGRGEMGDVRDYLKRKLSFSDADDKFITSFVRILHAEGGHSFMSEKEYFRLSKNIAIEIALFVISKYEKYKK